MTAEDRTELIKQVNKQRRSTQSEFRHNLFLLRTLVSNDFKLKYRRSVLGVLWSILNPLLMMIILAAVFSYMFKFNVPNFPLYLILGTVLFDYVNRATTGAVESIILAQSMIKKIRIEKMIFPIEKVLFELVNFAISLIAVALVFTYFQVESLNAGGGILISIHVIWGLPFLILCVAVFAAGLGLLLSALDVFFRDVFHLWSVVITAWTYATPIFYPIEAAPDWMQAAEFFNPMFHYLTFFRDIVMWNTNPGGKECLVCLAFAIVTFGIGLFVFRKTQSKFILYI